MPVDTEFLRDRTVLVTGGTGSFGKTILARLLQTSVGGVRVLSRDETKQDAMRHEYRDPRVDYVTGDVRDLSTVTEAMAGRDYVFHAAALKQVPNCERFPMEAIRTNVLGAANVAAAARVCVPRAVVAISTDKAVEPLNVMGLTKALMERILHGSMSSPSRMICVRYGNVVSSRGSVIPLFLDKIKKGLPLPVTHPKMTRFLLCLEDAVDLVIDAAREAADGELWVRKMPAATVETIAEACLRIAGSDLGTKEVGVRPGEKMHEVLVSEDEMRRAEERPDHFVVRGVPGDLQRGEYTSANTEQLDVRGVTDLLYRAGAA